MISHTFQDNLKSLAAAESLDAKHLAIDLLVPLLSFLLEEREGGRLEKIDFASESYRNETYLRFFVLLKNFLANEEPLKEEEFYRYCLHANDFRAVVHACRLSGGDAIVRLLTGETSGLSAMTVPKVLPMLELDKLNEKWFSVAKKLQPEQRLALYVSWLRCEHIFSSKGSENREYLINEATDLLNQIPISNGDLKKALSLLWMSLSYFSEHSRLKLKASINNAIRRECKGLDYIRALQKPERKILVTCPDFFEPG